MFVNGIYKTIDKAVSNKNITIKEAEELLAFVIKKTRLYLINSATSNFNINAENPYLTNTYLKMLEGRCGFVQSLIGYALQDLGLRVKPMATQSLKEYYHGHAALSLELPIENGFKWFLIDPTFGQFCTTERCNLDIEVPDPGYYLIGTEKGKEIADSLLRKGYVEIDPTMAFLYLSSFCKGHPPFKEESEAFGFLKDPPKNNMHYWFSRESMSRDKLSLIPS